MSIAGDALAVMAVVGGAVVYGADVFALLVLRPALARLDVATLTATMGGVHRFGDRRMPVPFVAGGLAALAAGVTNVVGGHGVAAICCAVSVGAYGVWLGVFLRVSAPLNRSLSAAEAAGRTRPDAHDLQRRWDRALPTRVILQTLALVALSLALAVP